MKYGNTRKTISSTGRRVYNIGTHVFYCDVIICTLVHLYVHARVCVCVCKCSSFKNKRKLTPDRVYIFKFFSFLRKRVPIAVARKTPFLPNRYSRQNVKAYVTEMQITRHANNTRLHNIRWSNVFRDDVSHPHDPSISFYFSPRPSVFSFFFLPSPSRVCDLSVACARACHCRPTIYHPRCVTCVCECKVHTLVETSLRSQPPSNTVESSNKHTPARFD